MSQGETEESTGLPSVDTVVGSVQALDEQPVHEHVAVFESAHDRLRAVLSSGGESAAPTA